MSAPFTVGDFYAVFIIAPIVVVLVRLVWGALVDKSDWEAP